MGTSITALFVDDDPGYLDLVESYLRSDGRDVDVLTADDADGCLSLLESEDVDCVVSDYQMPDVDGLELLDMVRDRRPDVPYLLYTGEGTEEVASDAIAAGVDDYVPKTAGADGLDLLANRIQNAVEQARAETAYREVFDNAVVGLTIHDADSGEVVAANQRFRSILGFDEEEEIEFADIFPGDEPYTLERGRELIREAAEDGRQSFEWKNRTQDGGTVWVEVELKPASINGVDRVIASVRDVSERKRQERRLQRQKDLLERTQRIADVGGWELDLETGELRWTEEIHRIRGVPEDVEPSLELAMETYHPDDRRDLEEAIDGAVEDGEPYDLELRMETPEGEQKWLRVRGERQTDDGEYLRGTIQDVTERKRRERRYDAIFNHTFGFTVLLNTRGRVLEVNETALEFGGVSRDDVVDDMIWETPWLEVDAETREFAVEAVESAAEGEFVRDELRVQGDDRTAIVDTSIRPVTDESGEVVLLVVEGREITRRKQREQELERTKKRLRSILDGSPDAVYVHDEEGRFLDVNTTACERLGYSRDELLDMRVEDVSPDIDQALLEDMFSDPDFTGTTIQVEHQMKDGSSYPVQVNVTRVELDGEDQFVAVVRDITELKRRETELRQQRDRFEEFASLVSHDIRNPLNVADGRLQMAIEETDSEHLEHVRRAHDRIEDIVDGMLDLAKEGERVEEFETVSLEHVAEQAWVHVDTEDCSLDLEDEVFLEADGGRVARLLENLYANAVEHGDADTVSVGTVKEDGVTRGFYVEDDGCGVDDVDRLFEAGYSTSQEGSGLGLSIVEEITEAHGWTVDAVDVDDGARFEVTDVDTRGEPE